MNSTNSQFSTIPPTPPVQPTGRVRSTGRVFVDWPTQVWLGLFGLVATIATLAASCVERQFAREIPHARAEGLPRVPEEPEPRRPLDA